MVETTAKKAVIELKKIKKLFKLLKEHNINYRFDVKSDKCYCLYNPTKIVIGVKYYLSSELDDLISAVLHEYIHIFCFKNNIYVRYHCRPIKFSISWEYWQWKRYLRRMALKIERFVDKKAAELMKQMFPDRKYRFGYSESNARNFLLNHYEI